MRKKISIVLSFYNEESVLLELIRRLDEAFSTLGSAYEAEYIFVNDASTDGSLELLRVKAKSDPRIKVISTSRNFGNPECTMAGFKYATGDAVVMMDSDLQDPPELIPVLVSKWEETGAEVVYTVRTSREGETRAKLWVTRIGYWILRMFSKVDLPVESGDFRLMSKKVVRHLLSLTEREPFLRGLVRWVGYRQEPVYYKREARFSGDTHFIFYSPFVIKNFLMGLTSFSNAPLYLIFVGGTLLSGIAFLYLLAVIVMKFLGWNLPGWSAIMSTELFFGGVNLLATGVMGLYVAKIHNEVKNRPNFIVAETINVDTASVLGASG